MKKAMELSTLTGCKVLLAVVEEDDAKLTVFKSFKEETEFTVKQTDTVERFTNSDVSSIFLIHFTH